MSTASMWVSIVAIISGAVTGIGAPIVSERIRRKSNRRELLLNRRIDSYAALLRVGARIRDNSLTWSAIPRAALDEAEDQELDRIFSEIRVVATSKVFDLVKDFSSKVQEFNRRLHMNALPATDKAHREGHTDSHDAITARMRLGDLAAEIDRIYTELLTTIRRETAEGDG